MAFSSSGTTGMNLPPHFSLYGHVPMPCHTPPPLPHQPREEGLQHQDGSSGRRILQEIPYKQNIAGLGPRRWGWGPTDEDMHVEHVPPSQLDLPCHWCGLILCLRPRDAAESASVNYLLDYLPMRHIFRSAKNPFGRQGAELYAAVSASVDYLLNQLRMRHISHSTGMFGRQGQT